MNPTAKIVSGKVGGEKTVKIKRKAFRTTKQFKQFHKTEKHLTPPVDSDTKGNHMVVQLNNRTNSEKTLVELETDPTWRFPEDRLNHKILMLRMIINGQKDSICANEKDFIEEVLKLDIKGQRKKLEEMMVEFRQIRSLYYNTPRIGG